MITEAAMTHEDMQTAVRKHYLCAKCQGNLTVAWGGGLGVNGWILRCANDIDHTGMTRHNKKSEQEIRRNIGMDSKALTTMDEQAMVARINTVKWPKELSMPEKKILAQVAIAYGLDPLMKEVSIYQGNPFVSIDGRYRAAQETGELDGVESKPATAEERLDWNIPAGDFFFKAAVYKKECSRPFVGWGRVFEKETHGAEFLPVVKNPQRIAEKRAEAQALRKAFHIPLPSAEDIGGPGFITPDADRNTGEIIESTATEIKAEPKPVATKKKPAPEPTPATPATSTTPDEVTGAEQQEEPASEETPVAKFFSWLQSKDKKYTPTWFYKTFDTYSKESMQDPENVEAAQKEVVEMMGW